MQMKWLTYKKINVSFYYCYVLMVDNIIKHTSLKTKIFLIHSSKKVKLKLLKNK